jgi:hypothetical protein
LETEPSLVCFSCNTNMQSVGNALIRYDTIFGMSSFVIEILSDYVPHDLMSGMQVFNFILAQSLPFFQSFQFMIYS